jgi:hypothetical protein
MHDMHAATYSNIEALRDHLVWALAVLVQHHIIALAKRIHWSETRYI